MPRTAVKTKKPLSFDALIQCFSQYLEQIEDTRVQGRCSHNLHDAVMSGFACMYFQDASLVTFQRRLDIDHNKNN